LAPPIPEKRPKETEEEEREGAGAEELKMGRW